MLDVYEVTDDPFPRPSHPTPSSASRPFPIPPPLGQRPTLRIITGAVNLPVLRPKPVHHPSIIKTAPLFDPAYAESVSSHYKVAEWRQQLSPVHHLDPPVSKHVRRVPAHRGHKRKFSDKFKNLFSALHLKRDDWIPFFQTDNPNETQGCKAEPQRPHRSPGTASFLVSRHLAPRHDIPHSAHSSSTAWSRPSEGKYRKCLLPPEAEISHFSNPTTLSSATSSSETGSTFAEATKDAHNVSQRPRDKSGVIARAMMLRRTVSLPQL